MMARRRLDERIKEEKEQEMMEKKNQQNKNGMWQDLTCKIEKKLCHCVQYKCELEVRKYVIVDN